MEDDGVLRSLQLRTNVGLSIFYAGWLIMLFAGPLGWNRQTVTDYGEGTRCIVNGQPVDCASAYFPAGVLPPLETHVVYTAAPYGFAFLAIIVGVLVLSVARSNWNILKQEMVDYAYRRAESEGKAPDLGFMHFFDNRYRGATEWGILRRSYAEMQSWSPEPTLHYGSQDRPYRMMAEEAAEIRCGGCGALRKPEDRFCSRCGTAFSD
ncbi:MAG: hypothetical protein ABIY70_12370 [Capsulimonas sp.]|uniref:hypothetical protein n=1 Tax=Capsulimonas sp. TaxID=2494211 RepID=UPI003264C46D